MPSRAIAGLDFEVLNREVQVLIDGDEFSGDSITAIVRKWYSTKYFLILQSLNLKGLPKTMPIAFGTMAEGKSYH